MRRRMLDALSQLNRIESEKVADPGNAGAH